jgi:hypothetical protein
MDHETFVRRVRDALTLKAEGRPGAAADAVRALLRDLAPATKAGVTDWHQQQALGLVVDTLDAAGRHEECRAAWQELIRFTQDTLTYWERALTSAREDFARWQEAHPPAPGSQ